MIDVQAGQTTVLTHFYRGELGRMMVWRERLDRTTNWAVIAVTGVVSTFWANVAFLHAGLIVGNAVLTLLLLIESRRYLFYDAYRARIRILESHWILPHVTQQAPAKETDWRDLLASDLVVPALKITIWEGMSRRLVRNYVWMYLLLFFAWAGKLRTSEAAAFPDLPLGVALTIFYLGLVALIAFSLRGRRASGEFTKPRRGDGNPWTL